MIRTRAEKPRRVILNRDGPRKNLMPLLDDARRSDMDKASQWPDDGKAKATDASRDPRDFGWRVFTGPWAEYWTRSQREETWPLLEGFWPTSSCPETEPISSGSKEMNGSPLAVQVKPIEPKNRDKIAENGDTETVKVDAVQLDIPEPVLEPLVGVVETVCDASLPGPSLTPNVHSVTLRDPEALVENAEICEGIRCLRYVADSVSDANEVTEHVLPVSECFVTGDVDTAIQEAQPVQDVTMVTPDPNERKVFESPGIEVLAVLPSLRNQNGVQYQCSSVALNTTFCKSGPIRMMFDQQLLPSNLTEPLTTPLVDPAAGLVVPPDFIPLAASSDIAGRRHRPVQVAKDHHGKRKRQRSCSRGRDKENRDHERDKLRHQRNQAHNKRRHNSRPCCSKCLYRNDPETCSRRDHSRCHRARERSKRAKLDQRIRGIEVDQANAELSKEASRPKPAAAGHTRSRLDDGRRRRLRSVYVRGLAELAAGSGHATRLSTIGGSFYEKSTAANERRPSTKSNESVKVVPSHSSATFTMQCPLCLLDIHQVHATRDIVTIRCGHIVCRPCISGKISCPVCKSRDITPFQPVKFLFKPVIV